ncbi:hypothetical protein [Deinococcus sp.]|uniref:hypothetical protein n=1 Tax=Deinococcus sp. TaxID=47478 RepID=UPI003CC586D4
MVRPRRTTLRDLIASAREAALDATYLTLTRELKAEQEGQLDALLGAGDDQESAWPRSPLEALKLPAKKESADTLLFLLARLTTLLELGLSSWPAVQTLPPEMRQQLALWGYRYDAWSLRRFPPSKRRAVLLCFLSMATAVTTDAVVDALDKVMNDIHNKARKRRQQLLQASQEARSRAVDVLEVLGTLTLDEAIPDPGLRSEIIQRYPREELTRLVEGSRQLREGDGSYDRLTESSWDYTRRFSPTLLRVMPFQWAEGSLIGQAVVHLRTFNAWQTQTRGRRADRLAATKVAALRADPAGWEHRSVPFPLRTGAAVDPGREAQGGGRHGAAFPPVGRLRGLPDSQGPLAE